MASVVPVLIVVILGLLVTRVATVMLVHTGMASESARFQARSAFLGVGFTTAEAEGMVNHPARRRIVMGLMWLGNAGIVTGVGALVLTFGADGGRRLEKAGVLIAGLVVLLLIARSPYFDRALSRVIERVLARWTDVEIRDYAALLHLREDFRVYELAVEEGDWVAGRRLGELRLRQEGVAVLGIERDQGYVGLPNGATTVGVGDVLVLYGRRDRLGELDARSAGAEGDAAHERAVAEHEAEDSTTPAA